MIAYKRADRVSDLIKAEIADILLRGMKDPLTGFVTVTDVEMTPDLKHAKVYFSILNEGDERTKIFNGLVKRLSYFRGELSRRLSLRYVPRLTFRMDTSAEYASHISRVLDEINRKNEEPPEN